MSSVKKNLAYNMFYQVLAIVLPFITAPYVSRVLGADGLGIYSYTYSIANYFMLFAMLGITNHGNRSIAATPKNKKALGECFVNNHAIQLCSGILVTAAYLFYVFVFSGNYRLYSLVQIFTVLSGIFDINWFFWGIEKFKLTVIRNTICKVISVACIFLFVRNRDDLVIYVLIMSLTILVSQLLLWNFIGREIEWIKPDWNLVKQNIKPVFVLFLPILAYSLYRVMDKIMIGNFSTMSEVGYYENAEKIINIPIGIITALGNVMLPRISNLVSRGQTSQQEKYIRISFTFVSIVEGALCFGISSVATLFSTLYFGTDYARTGQILQILVFTALISGWANIVRTQYLIPMKEDNVYVISMLSAAGVNFVLNMIFIPSYGAMGALVGTVAAETLVLIIQALSVRKELHFGLIAKENAVYILFGFLMFLLVRAENRFLDISGFGKLLAQILSGAAFYVGVIGVYSYFRKNIIFQYARNVRKHLLHR